MKPYQFVLSFLLCSWLLQMGWHLLSSWQASQANYEPTIQLDQGFHQGRSLLNLNAPLSINGVRSSNQLVHQAPDSSLKDLDLQALYPRVVTRPAPVRERLSIIVPYRDRQKHLNTFVNIMGSFIAWNNLNAEIVIVEQCDSSPFNRAKLFNVGIHNTLEESDYFCFHDIDMIPANGLAGHLYSFPSHGPRHNAHNVQQFSYRLPSRAYTGGIICMTKEDVLKVNGFSNIFWAWGAEDDEIRHRIFAANLTLERPDFALYWSLKRNHTPRDRSRHQGNKVLASMSAVRQRMTSEGLSSLKYRLSDSAKRPGYYWLCADLQMDESADF